MPKSLLLLLLLHPTRIVADACATASRRGSGIGSTYHHHLRSACIRCNALDRRRFATSRPARHQPSLPPPVNAIASPHLPQSPGSDQARARKLPVVCPGCGALSQTVDKDVAGFYGRKGRKTDSRKKQEEERAYHDAIERGAIPHVGDGAVRSSESTAAAVTAVPVCDRCHYLRHQSRGESIVHPSMHSIRQMIEDSPHHRNHIYHVLDAADFPLSLIPNLQAALRLPRLRTQNRRSKSMNYARGRVAEVSFIITRSDLLGRQKDVVDHMLPRLREILRDALGRGGKNVRLGNLRCVSTQRGWWTRVIKEDIWERGGAGWMVGKVNVGKSALYEVVFPKGRRQQDASHVRQIRDIEQKRVEEELSPPGADEAADDPRETVEWTKVASGFSDSPGELSERPVGSTSEGDDPRAAAGAEHEPVGAEDLDKDEVFDEDLGASLLPPAQLEQDHPQMPLVSSLPGTTALPIRIPFGNGRGELIDLPGVERSTLSTHVQPAYRRQLVMARRIVPEQYSIADGQSLILGGIIRITPRPGSPIVLMYPFLPIKAHATSTAKAIGVQTGFLPDGEPYSGAVESIATDAAKQNMKHARTVQLKWDITKARTGTLTHQAAGKMKPENLPFIIYGADVLVEGVGWVEIACQVRKRRHDDTSAALESETSGTASSEPVPTESEEPQFPEVEMWSPEGKYIGSRPPMNVWLLGGPPKVAIHARRQRARQTISMKRRQEGGARGGSPKTKGN